MQKKVSLILNFDDESARAIVSACGMNQWIALREESGVCAKEQILNSVLDQVRVSLRDICDGTGDWAPKSECVEATV